MRTKTWMTMVAIASLSFSLSTAACADSLPYKDISDSFAQTAIVQLTQAGDIHGYPNGTFRPHAVITRGQFLAYMMNVLEPYTGITAVPHGTFYPDVPPGNWDYNVVGSAQVAGWLNTYWLNLSDGFHENDQASRGDAASMFVGALEHSKFDFTLPQGVTPLTYATELGMFAGLPATANPVYFNRADAAVVLNNVLTLCKQFVAKGPVGIRGELPDVVSGSSSQTSSASTTASTASTTSSTTTSSVPFTTMVTTSGSQTDVVLGFNYGGSLASDLTEDEQDTDVNTIVYDGFHLNSSLQFNGTLPASFADTLHTYGKQVYGLFGTEDPTLLTEALATTQSRAALVQQIASVCDTSHLDGANIDFEDVPGSLESDLTAFMQQLTTALQASGMKTSIDVAVPSAGSWSQAYEYGQLGKITNYVFLMAYDEHWSGDITPGTVASLQWVQNNVNILLQDGTPADHLILGLPLYTRAWQTGNTTQMHSIPIGEMESMIASGQTTQSSFDQSVNQWVNVYNDSTGAQWEFWQDGFKNLQSMGSLAIKDQLAGVGYWQLGDETPSQWSFILPVGLGGTAIASSSSNTTGA
ncbi:MAG: glycosyl hydrolase family 18 protein [Acidibacillus sp.]|nr:glycosyl hydrolase family 18 protein [Acidibacillus sp.]